MEFKKLYYLDNRKSFSDLFMSKKSNFTLHTSFYNNT